jgi:hypothetical protein
MRAARVLLFGVLPLLVTGCTIGPMFRVDPELKKAGGLRVDGGKTETAVCTEAAGGQAGTPARESPPPPPKHPFEAGRRISFGDVVAEVDTVRTGTKTSHLMADASLRALASARESAGNTADAAKLRLATASVAAESSPEGGAKVARAAAKISGALATTLGAIDDLTTLASLPNTSAEQMSFAITVKRPKTAVVLSCQSVDVVHHFKLYAGPDFAMDCAVVPVAGEPLAPWAMRVRATGTSRSFRFSGGLARATPRTDLLFGDQHFGFGGSTEVTGFEIRSNGRQSAAVSFYPYINGKYADEPRVWLLPASPDDASEQDVRAAMMALAVLYPWPDSCSTQQKLARCGKGGRGGGAIVAGPLGWGWGRRLARGGGSWVFSDDAERLGDEIDDSEEDRRSAQGQGRDPRAYDDFLPGKRSGRIFVATGARAVARRRRTAEPTAWGLAWLGREVGKQADAAVVTITNQPDGRALVRVVKSPRGEASPDEDGRSCLRRRGLQERGNGDRSRDGGRVAHGERVTRRR